MMALLCPIAATVSAIFPWLPWSRVSLIRSRTRRRFVGFVLEQLHRVVDRIQNCRSAIARLQISQVVADEGLVLREIPCEIHLAVELHDGNPGGPQREQRVKHRHQSLYARKLGVSAASLLNRNDQRDWLAFRCLIEACRLLDAVVFHDEVLGLQSIHDSALLVFYQRWNQHNVGLRSESCFLREGGCR